MKTKYMKTKYMKTILRSGSSFGSISFILMFILMFASSTFGKTTIRFATVAPEGSAWMEVMNSLNKELIEQSGGDLQFKFYPNMTMGDEKDIVRKMRLGQLQGAGFTGFGLGEILPEVRILELPYLFESDAEIDYVADQMFDYFNNAFMEKGFVLLGWADVGWIYFFGNQPVAEPKDLRKSKVWMWMGDPLAEAFFAELKKSPVPLSVTDVLLSLQTGLIDAVYGSPLAALALQWFTQVEYVSDIPFTHSIGAALMQKKAFDKLQPEQQKLLIDLSKKHMRALILKSRIDNKDAYNLILKEGVKKVSSTQNQRDTMHQLGLRVHQRLANDLYDRALLDRVQTLLNEYRSASKAQNQP